MCEPKQKTQENAEIGLPTDFALFEEDPKAKVEEILDELDVKSDLRPRKEILRSIKRQNG